MKLTNNIIFITGGGSGIGRGLAEALHAKGNKVIISGRRKDLLEKVIQANPGMDFVKLDIQNLQSIKNVAATLIEKYPNLNVLINNAGIAQLDNIQTTIDDEVLLSTVTTNLLGPIRMASALIEHLKQQPSAYIINVTSGLAFVPLAMSAVYCASKAALHSYSMSQRYMLKDTNVNVLELAPPYVQTELMGQQQANDPRAMPLKEFIDKTLKALETDHHEILVDQVMFLRKGAGLNDNEVTMQFNDAFASH